MRRISLLFGKSSTERTFLALCGKPPEVVIWSINSTGHRSYFVKLLLTKLIASKTPSLLVNLDHSEGLESVLDYVSQIGDHRNHIERMSMSLHAVGKLVRSKTAGQKAVTHVCLDGDRGFLLMPLMGVWTARVLLVRSPSVFPRAGTARARLKLVLVRIFEFLGFTFFHLSHPGAVLARRVEIFRDPSPFLLHDYASVGPGQASEEVPAKLNTKQVAIFGSIDSRKQPELVLQACSRLPGVGLRVVGKWESDTHFEEFMTLASRLGVTVEAHNAFLDDGEFLRQMSSADVVAVMNQNLGSSGIALGAYDLGIPLVMSGSESMRQMAGGLGAIWADPTASDLAAAFSEALNSKMERKRTKSERGRHLPTLDEFCHPFLPENEKYLGSNVP